MRCSDSRKERKEAFGIHLDEIKWSRALMATIVMIGSYFKASMKHMRDFGGALDSFEIEILWLQSVSIVVRNQFLCIFMFCFMRHYFIFHSFFALESHFAFRNNGYAICICSRVRRAILRCKIDKIHVV